MYVPLYNATGALTAPLRKDRYVLSVDTELRNILAGMGEGNHTYLQLKGEAGVEIVKVWGVDSSGVHIIRGIDYTEALPFNVGDLVSYTLTAAEIQDRYVLPTLAVYAAEALELIDGVITYPELTLAPYGASEIVGSKDGIEIGRREGAYGCCDGDNAPFPIQQTPFYLTTPPYAVLIIEGWQSVTSWVKAVERGLNIDHWQADASWVSSVLRDILKNYDQPPVDFWQAEASWVSSVLREILKNYDQPPVDFWQADASWVSGTLKEILIVYSNYPPDNWQADASWVSGSLE